MEQAATQGVQYVDDAHALDDWVDDTAQCSNVDSAAVLLLSDRLARMELLTCVFGAVLLLLVFAVFYTRWWTQPTRRRRGNDVTDNNGRVFAPPPTTGSQVPPVIGEHEASNDASTSLDDDAARSSVRRRHRRNVSLGKRIYRTIVGSGASTGSSGSPDPSPSSGRSPARTTRATLGRRHSVSSTASYAAGVAKNWLTFSQSPSTRTTRGRTMPQPPAEFFEPDRLNVQVPTHLSPEIFYVLHHLKSLELPEKWILNPADIEVKTYEAGEIVFRPDKPDQYLYVVIDGCLSVYINVGCPPSSPSAPHRTQDATSKKEYLMKQVHNGDAVFSLLSVLDVMAGMESIFRTVSARAITRTTVAQYSISGFREAFHRDPQAWIRPVQIVITRLMHVTLTTCHHYLGLSAELTRPTLEQPSEHARQRHLSGAAPGGIQRKRRLSGEDDVKSLQALAVRKFAQALELSSKDHALLESRVKVRSYGENVTIVEQRETDKNSLMIVLSGSIKLVQKSNVTDSGEDGGEQITTGLVLSDELVGGLQMLTGEPAFFTLQTRNAVRVACMDGVDYHALMDVRPSIILPVCKSVLSRLSTFLRGIDFAIDWRMVDTGQALYRQGDTADCLHVVLSGRLRSVIASSASKRDAVEEFGRGDLVGMVEVLLKKPRTTTVMAVRFSQLATVPSGLLDYIKVKFPEVGFRMISLLGNYYTNYHRKFMSGISNEPLGHVRNLHTIAVLPASRNVPLVAFTCELYNALQAYMPVLRLSSYTAGEHLGVATVQKERDFRMMHWLNAQEDTYPLVIYECDYEFTKWTRRCLHQADALLVVCNGNDDPDYGFLEQQIEMQPEGARTNRELIFLWPPNTQNPHGTVDWIKTRGWFSGHHHIRCPARMYQWSPDHLLDGGKQTGGGGSLYGGPRGEAERSVIDFYEESVYGLPCDLHSHFSRVARLLTGNAIGLVLGGGGARGAAHVGIMKAMHEAGVPVDIVAGVSIGAMIGGIYCDTQTPSVMASRTKAWFMHMTSFWQKLIDLTYHHSAIFTGSGFNKGIVDVFGNREIDDLWIPYFCVSTDLSEHKMRVHRTGSLWHYVRASMSLAGYLPPMCDPTDGHLLLDGGYVNNLPADVMYTVGVRLVLAVDVGSAEEMNFTNYGDHLNGFWVLWMKWWPWATPIRVMDMQEIQDRLAYVSCVRQLEQVKKMSYCRYIRPPIDEYKTLDFGKFDEIHDIGYAHGQKLFEELLRTDEKLYSILHPGAMHDAKQPSRAILRKYRAHSESSRVEASPSFHTLVASPSSAQPMRLDGGVPVGSLSSPTRTNSVQASMSFSDLAHAVSRLPIGMRQFVTERRQKVFEMMEDLPDVWETETDEESLEDGGRTSGLHMRPPNMSRQCSKNTSETGGSRLHSPRLSIDDPRMLMTQTSNNAAQDAAPANDAAQDAAPTNDATLDALATMSDAKDRLEKETTPSDDVTPKEEERKDVKEKRDDS